MQDKRLLAMLEAEQNTKQQLLDPAVFELRIPFGFYPEQVGLSECLCSADGRIWRLSGDGKTLTVIFNPKWPQATIIVEGKPNEL